MSRLLALAALLAACGGSDGSDGGTPEPPDAARPKQITLKNDYAASIFSLSVSGDGWKTGAGLCSGTRLDYQQSTVFDVPGSYRTASTLSANLDVMSLGETRAFRDIPLDMTKAGDAWLVYDWDPATAKFVIFYDVH